MKKKLNLAIALSAVLVLSASIFQAQMQAEELSEARTFLVERSSGRTYSAALLNRSYQLAVLARAQADIANSANSKRKVQGEKDAEKAWNAFFQEMKVWLDERFPSQNDAGERSNMVEQLKALVEKDAKDLDLQSENEAMALIADMQGRKLLTPVNDQPRDSAPVDARAGQIDSP